MARNTERRKLRIAVVAPLEERVPPPKYGGTELVVYNLTEELVKQGHDVDLYAVGTSATSAHLIPIFPTPIRLHPRYGSSADLREAAKFLGVAKIVEALKRRRYHIIHNHLGWRLSFFANLLAPTPFVTTLHGPLTPSRAREMFSLFPHFPYITISNSQRKPFRGLRYVATVYNGIELEKFPLSTRSRDYVAFLGRMSPEKGSLEAIRIAKKARVRLVMAAKVDLVDRKYFTNEIKPLIDGRQIRYLGEVDHRGKVELLAHAKALLAPIQWEEPFGLYFVEAMACGTPVIAFRRGSVPEIIKDRKTGFIVRTVAEAVRAVRHIPEIDRGACRAHVERHFTAQVMAQHYLAAYRKLMR